jgi:hypothetical protein
LVELDTLAWFVLVELNTPGWLVLAELAWPWLIVGLVGPVTKSACQ